MYYSLCVLSHLQDNDYISTFKKFIFTLKLYKLEPSLLVIE